MLEEFKKFALRGNVVDLAVGVIIGAAFGAIGPDLTRHRDNARELGALHLLADANVLGRAGRETALRAECELLELDGTARLIDAALEQVGSLELRDLGGDQAEHHNFVGRYRT